MNLTTRALVAAQIVADEHVGALRGPGLVQAAGEEELLDDLQCAGWLLMRVSRSYYSADSNFRNTNRCFELISQMCEMCNAATFIVIIVHGSHELKVEPVPRSDLTLRMASAGTNTAFSSGTLKRSSTIVIQTQRAAALKVGLAPWEKILDKRSQEILKRSIWLIRV